MCGTYKEKLISTISFYVVLIPYGIGDVVLISLTMEGAFDEQVHGVFLRAIEKNVLTL